MSRERTTAQNSSPRSSEVRPESWERAAVTGARRTRWGAVVIVAAGALVVLTGCGLLVRPSPAQEAQRLVDQTLEALGDVEQVEEPRVEEQPCYTPGREEHRSAGVMFVVRITEGGVDEHIDDAVDSLELRGWVVLAEHETSNLKTNDREPGRSVTLGAPAANHDDISSVTLDYLDNDPDLLTVAITASCTRVK